MYQCYVALLAEGVDRNLTVFIGTYVLHPSPSSRRAWIEMNYQNAINNVGQVALLAEGVDRN